MNNNTNHNTANNCGDELALLLNARIQRMSRVISLQYVKLKSKDVGSRNIDFLQHVHNPAAFGIDLENMLLHQLNLEIFSVVRVTPEEVLPYHGAIPEDIDRKIVVPLKVEDFAHQLTKSQKTSHGEPNKPSEVKMKLEFSWCENDARTHSWCELDQCGVDEINETMGSALVVRFDADFYGSNDANVDIFFRVPMKSVIQSETFFSVKEVPTMNYDQLVMLLDDPDYESKKPQIHAELRSALSVENIVNLTLHLVASTGIPPSIIFRLGLRGTSSLVTNCLWKHLLHPPQQPPRDLTPKQILSSIASTKLDTHSVSGVSELKSQLSACGIEDNLPLSLPEMLKARLSHAPSSVKTPHPSYRVNRTGLYINVIELDLASAYPAFALQHGLDFFFFSHPAFSQVLKSSQPFLPSVFRHLLQSRSKFQQLRREDKSSQLAYKLLVNAMVGQLRYKNQFFYDPDLGGAIIDGVKCVLDAIEKHANNQLGLHVVYGYTDSLMFVRQAQSTNESLREKCERLKEDFETGKMEIEVSTQSGVHQRRGWSVSTSSIDNTKSIDPPRMKIKIEKEFSVLYVTSNSTSYIGRLPSSASANDVQEDSSVDDGDVEKLLVIRGSVFKPSMSIALRGVRDKLLLSLLNQVTTLSVSLDQPVPFKQLCQHLVVTSNQMFMNFHVELKKIFTSQSPPGILQWCSFLSKDPSASLFRACCSELRSPLSIDNNSNNNNNQTVAGDPLRSLYEPLVIFVAALLNQIRKDASEVSLSSSNHSPPDALPIHDIVRETKENDAAGPVSEDRSETSGQSLPQTSTLFFQLLLRSFENVQLKDRTNKQLQRLVRPNQIATFKQNVQQLQASVDNVFDLEPQLLFSRLMADLFFDKFLVEDLPVQEYRVYPVKYTCLPCSNTLGSINPSSSSLGPSLNDRVQQLLSADEYSARVRTRLQPLLEYLSYSDTADRTFFLRCQRESSGECVQTGSLSLDAWYHLQNSLEPVLNLMGLKDDQIRQFFSGNAKNNNNNNNNNDDDDDNSTNINTNNNNSPTASPAPQVVSNKQIENWKMLNYVYVELLFSLPPFLKFRTICSDNAFYRFRYFVDDTAHGATISWNTFDQIYKYSDKRQIVIKSQEGTVRSNSQSYHNNYNNSTQILEPVSPSSALLKTKIFSQVLPRQYKCSWRILFVMFRAVSRLLQHPCLPSFLRSGCEILRSSTRDRHAHEIFAEFLQRRLFENGNVRHNLTLLPEAQLRCGFTIFELSRLLIEGMVMKPDDDPHHRHYDMKLQNERVRFLTLIIVLALDPSLAQIYEELLQYCEERLGDLSPDSFMRHCEPLLNLDDANRSFAPASVARRSTVACTWKSAGRHKTRVLDCCLNSKNDNPQQQQQQQQSNQRDVSLLRFSSRLRLDVLRCLNVSCLSKEIESLDDNTKKATTGFENDVDLKGELEMFVEKQLPFLSQALRTGLHLRQHQQHQHQQSKEKDRSRYSQIRGFLLGEKTKGLKKDLHRSNNNRNNNSNNNNNAVDNADNNNNNNNDHRANPGSMPFYPSSLPPCLRTFHDGVRPGYAKYNQRLALGLVLYNFGFGPDNFGEVKDVVFHGVAKQESQQQAKSSLSDNKSIIMHQCSTMANLGLCPFVTTDKTSPKLACVRRYADGGSTISAEPEFLPNTPGDMILRHYEGKGICVKQQQQEETEMEDMFSNEWRVGGGGGALNKLKDQADQAAEKNKKNQQAQNAIHQKQHAQRQHRSSKQQALYIQQQQQYHHQQQFQLQLQQQLPTTEQERQWERQEKIIQHRGELATGFDKKVPDTYHRLPLFGLQNLGNTCYANSVINLLVLCPEFSRSLFSAGDPPSEVPEFGGDGAAMDEWIVKNPNDRLRLIRDYQKPPMVIKPLKQLHNALFSKRSAAFEMMQFRTLYRKAGVANFFGLHFQDAGEFLTHLGDKTLPHLVYRPSFQENADCRGTYLRPSRLLPNGKDEEILHATDTVRYTHDGSGEIEGGIRNLFGFQTRQNRFCHLCYGEKPDPQKKEAIKSNVEWSWVLQLSIVKPKKNERVTVQYLMDQYVRLEQESENFKCDYCNRQSLHSGSYTFRILPEVLLVQLKRFGRTNAGESVKVFDEVHLFGKNLELTEEFEEPTKEESEYNADRTGPVKTLHVAYSEVTKYRCEYELRGIVVHDGKDLSGYHYYGFYKGPLNFRADYSSDDHPDEKKNYEERMRCDGASAGGRWVRVNDTIVEHDGPEPVSRPTCQLGQHGFCEIEKNAYILRYHLVKKTKLQQQHQQQHQQQRQNEQQQQQQHVQQQQQQQQQLQQQQQQGTVVEEDRAASNEQQPLQQQQQCPTVQSGTRRQREDDNNEHTQQHLHKHGIKNNENAITSNESDVTLGQSNNYGNNNNKFNDKFNDNSFSVKSSQQYRQYISSSNNSDNSNNNNNFITTTQQLQQDSDGSSTQISTSRSNIISSINNNNNNNNNNIIDSSSQPVPSQSSSVQIISQGSTQLGASQDIIFSSNIIKNKKGNTNTNNNNNNNNNANSSLLEINNNTAAGVGESIKKIIIDKNNNTDSLMIITFDQFNAKYGDNLIVGRKLITDVTVAWGRRARNAPGEKVAYDAELEREGRIGDRYGIEAVDLQTQEEEVVTQEVVIEEVVAAGLCDPSTVPVPKNVVGDNQYKGLFSALQELGNFSDLQDGKWLHGHVVTTYLLVASFLFNKKYGEDFKIHVESNVYYTALETARPPTKKDRTKKTANEKAVTEDAAVQNEVAEDAAVQNEVAEDAVNEKAVTEDAATEKAAAGNEATEETAAEKAQKAAAELHEKDLCLFPICVEGSDHWTLVAWWPNEKVIQYWDSLPSNEEKKKDADDVVEILLKEIRRGGEANPQKQFIWGVKKPNTSTSNVREKRVTGADVHAECTNQGNGYDCGLYVCQFAVLMMIMQDRKKSVQLAQQVKVVKETRCKMMMEMLSEIIVFTVESEIWNEVWTGHLDARGKGITKGSSNASSNNESKK